MCARLPQILKFSYTYTSPLIIPQFLKNVKLRLRYFDPAQSLHYDENSAILCIEDEERARARRRSKERYKKKKSLKVCIVTKFLLYYV